MTACEWCWTKAANRAASRGGATVDHYRDILEEQERLGAQADCPQARLAPGATGATGGGA